MGLNDFDEQRQEDNSDDGSHDDDVTVRRHINGHVTDDVKEIVTDENGQDTDAVLAIVNLTVILKAIKADVTVEGLYVAADGHVHEDATEGIKDVAGVGQSVEGH